MNCLTEAMGLALPGNGTLLATHADREACSNAPGGASSNWPASIEGDDASILPRSVGFKAFENAMALDIAMGSSTNTILHLLAIAQEAEIAFTMQDIDRLSRVIPQLCKVAPNTENATWKTYTAPVAFLPSWVSWSARGELHTECPPCTPRPWAKPWRSGTWCAPRMRPYTPSSKPAPVAFPRRWPLAKVPAGPAWIWTVPWAASARTEHAFSKEGGLAILVGNIALNGCVVKTAGVDDSILVFEGPAHVR